MRSEVHPWSMYGLFWEQVGNSSCLVITRLRVVQLQYMFYITLERNELLYKQAKSCNSDRHDLSELSEFFVCYMRMTGLLKGMQYNSGVIFRGRQQSELRQSEICELSVQVNTPTSDSSYTGFRLARTKTMVPIHYRFRSIIHVYVGRISPGNAGK